MKNFRVVAIGIVALIMLCLANCSSDADIDRRNKAQACVYLVRAALLHNDDYFPDVAKTLTFKESDSDDLMNKFLNKALLNCYNTVSMIKSADLIGRGKPEKISPYAKDNMEILNLSNYHKRYDTDSARLEKDEERLIKTLEGLKEELVPLRDAANKLAKDLTAQFRREMLQDESKKRKEETEDTGDNVYGNVNMGWLKRMDPDVKLAIGFGLMLTFALFFFLGLKALRNSELEEKEKKNKNKKKK
jgi:hypothetical protein